MGKFVIFAGVLVIIAIVLSNYKSRLNSSPTSPQTINQTSSPKLTSESTPQANFPKTEVIATGLEVPWALAILPFDTSTSLSAQGRPETSILITERKGTVRLIDKEGKLLSNPIAKLDVRQTGESGLHGIAIHPQFPEKPYVYLYYTYTADPVNSLNRVSRFTFYPASVGVDGVSLKDEQIIVDKIPAAIFHDGGRIKFGPDGYLYITTGDAQNPSLAQNTQSLAGKILRVTDEGKPAPSNPFNSLVFSYGHRNPQGISWDDQGRLWETEHGQTATDEINLIEPGKNYGWPTIRGDQKASNMLTPKLHSDSSTWAPAGAAYFNGSIFFGGLRGQTLYQALINGDSITLKEHFKGEFGRIREVVLGPDNLLYISTSNRDGRGKPSSDDDRIIRIDPRKL